MADEATPRRVWRVIHYASFAALVTGTVHGALAGADRGHPLAQAGALVGVTAVLMLVVFRVLNAGATAESSRTVRTALPVDTAAVGVPGAASVPDEDGIDPAVAERLARLGNRVRVRS